MLPATTYGAETGILTKQARNKLAAAQTKLERSMFNISHTRTERPTSGSGRGQKLFILYIMSLNLSLFANCRSQFLLDRLGGCLKLFVSTESTSPYEFPSQFVLAMFLYAKNTQNYRED